MSKSLGLIFGILRYNPIPYASPHEILASDYLAAVYLCCKELILDFPPQSITDPHVYYPLFGPTLITRSSIENHVVTYVLFGMYLCDNIVPR